MSPRIYDKTDKGREEIATRKYQLQSKLRTLLVMIDGRHSLESLLKNFAVLGLGEDNIDELLQQDYVRLVSGGPEVADDDADRPAAPAPRPASARARLQARTRSQAERQAHAVDADGTGSQPCAEAAEAAAGDAARCRALHDFYHQAIMDAIGLRGIRLQLKLEQAAGIADFRALRLPFLQAALKAKGRATARELRERLDALFGGPPEPDDFLLPDENGAAQRGLLDYFNLANDSVNF